VRNQSARIKVRMCALEAQIALLRGDAIREDILQDCLAHFEVSKSASMPDFNAESLILALQSVGDMMTRSVYARSMYRRIVATPANLPRRSFWLFSVYAP
jgi:hypothetical protein